MVRLEQRADGTEISTEEVVGESRNEPGGHLCVLAASSEQVAQPPRRLAHGLLGPSPARLACNQQPGANLSRFEGTPLFRCQATGLDELCGELLTPGHVQTVDRREGQLVARPAGQDGIRADRALRLQSLEASLCALEVSAQAPRDPQPQQTPNGQVGKGECARGAHEGPFGVRERGLFFGSFEAPLDLGQLRPTAPEADLDTTAA